MREEERKKVCVFVCVCERERERERECVCMCVCVCVREREKQKKGLSPVAHACPSSHSHTCEGRCKATWKREFELPWCETGSLHHHDDIVDSDQEVVNKELSLSLV